MALEIDRSLFRIASQKSQQFKWFILFLPRQPQLQTGSTLDLWEMTASSRITNYIIFQGWLGQGSQSLSTVATESITVRLYNSQ